MARTLRIVDVKDRVELTSATLTDEGQVVYAHNDHGVAETVVRQRMRDTGEDLEAAFAGLAKDGWSNGYLMVDREV